MMGRRGQPNARGALARQVGRRMAHSSFIEESHVKLRDAATAMAFSLLAIGPPVATTGTGQMSS